MSTATIPATSVCRAIGFDGKSIRADVSLVTATGQMLASRAVEPALTDEQIAVLTTIRDLCAEIALPDLVQTASNPPVGSMMARPI